MRCSMENLIFVGFNSYVLALDRNTGEMIWNWQCPKPRSAGYVTLLLDGDRLVASVNGYVYCLDPGTGTMLWNNPTSGYGTGVTSIVSVRGSTAHDLTAKVAKKKADDAAATAAVGT